MLIGPGTLYPAPSNIVLLCYCKQSAIACYKLHALCIFWKCTGLCITALYLLHCTALCFTMYHCVSLRCTALCLTNGALGQKVQQLWGCCNGLIPSSSATTSIILSSASSEIQTNLKGNPPLAKMDEFPKTPNQSVTFVKILIRMNVRIYSYQQNYTNEYPNIFILIF